MFTIVAASIQIFWCLGILFKNSQLKDFLGLFQCLWLAVLVVFGAID